MAVAVLLAVGGVTLARQAEPQATAAAAPGGSPGATVDERPAGAGAEGGAEPVQASGTASFEASASASATAAQTQPAPDPCAAPSWVAAWSAAPQDSTAEQPPNLAAGMAEGEAERPQSFDNLTLRQIVTPTAAGSRARIHLSNRFGRGPVTFQAVHVARRAEGPAVVPDTDRVVTFGGAPSITIPPGGTVVSDEIDLPVEPFADLAVSTHVAGPAPLDVHLFGQQTQYLTAAGAGDHTGDPAGDAFTGRLGSWLALTGVDVLAPRRAGAVVALGDSITDGVGSTPDANQRWTDHLARRLLADPAGARLTVVNAGIGGNQMTRDNVFATAEVGWGMGPSAVTRFGPDVIDRAGVTDVVVFIGINDLYMPTGPDPVGAIVAGYRAIADRARFAGIGIIGTTITPGGLGPDKEPQRLAVNDWIRTSGAFDTVVDLDALVRDPADASKVDPRFAADPVHLNDAGYAAVASAFDLGTFRGTGCPI